MLKPRQPVPALTVPTVGGGTWSLLGILPMFDPPRDDSKATIEKANAINDRPVVVEFRTDASEKVFPMVPPGQSNSDIVVGPGEEDVVQ